MKRDPWVLVEIGGTSAQTARRDESGRFWFTPGVVQEPGCTTALACPGVIRGQRVLYATNLGWPDDADPAKELGLDRLALVVNDAVAAALGESILREGGRPERDLVYVSLGTGVGSAAVAEGIASDLDLGHRLIGGALYCDGCRNTGCLNSELSSRRLPARLARDDQERVARLLAVALEGVATDEQMLVVVGGGIGRRYPGIASMLDRLIPNRTQITIAPTEAKSSAYAGLDYLSRMQSQP